MKRARKKSYLFLGLAVLILAAVALSVILFAFNQGTVEENSKVLMIVLAVLSGIAGLAGLIGIIMFFAKTYPAKKE